MNIVLKIIIELKRPLQFVHKLYGKLLYLSAPYIGDKLFLKLKWRHVMGYPLDLDNPVTFNEKLQWLKLYDRKPEYTQMVDKVEAKKYVADIIGEEYVIPTLAVYDRAEDIDFDALPNQFVLKCSHDSGGIVICKDKSTLDKKAAVGKLRKGLKHNFYWQSREWPYKNVRPRIIVEQYMEEKIASCPSARIDLTDYKFYCFNGKPMYCQVIRDRHTKETIDFFDMEWNHMPFYGQNPVAKNGQNPVARPIHLNKMIEIARRLSKDMPFVRIDLYVVNDKEYFGEVTYYPASGLGTFTPKEWNTRLGDLITLSGLYGGGYKVRLRNKSVDISECHFFDKELYDYKFFCFNGVPQFMFIASDRFNKDEETKFDFFDMNFQHLPFTNGHPNSSKPIQKPRGFEEMKRLAEKLSSGIPQVRIDFYDIEGQIYFGEITFYHWSGFVKFNPIEWDKKFGELIELPNG